VPLQTQTDASPSGVPFSFAAPSPLTSGSVQLLVIALTDTVVLSVSDSLGETWVLDDEELAYGGGDKTYAFRCDTSVSGSAPTITVSGSSAGLWAYCYVEDNLMGQGGPVTIGDGQGQGTGPAVITTPAVGTNGNIGVGFCGAFQADVSADTGETLTAAQAWAPGVSGGAGIIYQTATVDSTTFTATLDLDNFCNWSAIAIVYPPGSGGGGGGGGGSYSGAGTIPISSPAAVEITITPTPTAQGQGMGNPTRYFALGNVAWGNSGYASRNYYIEHLSERVEAPFAADTLYYSFAFGLTATLTFV
jgi:hypothetical protein